MVERGVTTALILEDDADWDIRIKTQMRDFARASRTLLQPISNTLDVYLDPTYPRPLANTDPSELSIDDQKVSRPSTSPYGDISRWDILWVGHCGCRFPTSDDRNVPIGRVVLRSVSITLP